MRKSQLLRWAGVLLMPASLLRFFFGLSMFNFFTSALSFGALKKTDLALPGAALAVIALSCLAELVTGFLGVLNWEEPKRAGRCTVWGFVTLGWWAACCKVWRATASASWWASRPSSSPPSSAPPPCAFI